MQTLPEGMFVQAPGVCFLCELAPDPDLPLVDTLREFQPGGFTHLNGRKYVCDPCVRALTKARLVEDEEIL